MILVTNDDGDSEGLRMLLEVAKRSGKAVAIVPNRQRSAVSGALTLHKPLRLHKIDQDLYSINGTPSDCVLFALFSGEFPRPSLVISGINWGDNTGLGSLMGSGTVGACWQAALENVPSIAFSMTRTDEDWRQKESWGERQKTVDAVAGIVEMLKPQLGPGKFFNVNLPRDLARAKIVNMKHLQKERYDTKCEKRLDPDGKPYYWISGKTKKVEKGTDTHELIVNKNITISEISLSALEKGG